MSVKYISIPGPWTCRSQVELMEKPWCWRCETSAYRRSELRTCPLLVFEGVYSAFPLRYLFSYLEDLFSWKTGKTSSEKPQEIKPQWNQCNHLLGKCLGANLHKIHLCLPLGLQFIWMAALRLKGSMYARMTASLKWKAGPRHDALKQGVLESVERAKGGRKWNGHEQRLWRWDL